MASDLAQRQFTIAPTFIFLLQKNKRFFIQKEENDADGQNSIFRLKIISESLMIICTFNFILFLYLFLFLLYFQRYTVHKRALYFKSTLFFLLDSFATTFLFFLRRLSTEASIHHRTYFYIFFVCTFNVPVPPRGVCTINFTFFSHEMDGRLHGWVFTPGTAGSCTKRYTVHERALYFNSTFFFALSTHLVFFIYLFFFAGFVQSRRFCSLLKVTKP